MIKTMTTYNVQLQDIIVNDEGSNYPDGRWLDYYNLARHEDRRGTPILSDAVIGSLANGAHLSDGAARFAADLDENPIVLTYVRDYVLARFFDNVVISTTEFPSGDMLGNKLLAIIYFIDSTKDKHIKVITAIEGAGDLMKSVSSISKNIFNDTPQTPDPDLDTHVTNYTKSISESEFNTPMARIAEIRDTFLNEMELWSREFMERFIIF